MRKGRAAKGAGGAILLRNCGFEGGKWAPPPVRAEDAVQGAGQPRDVGGRHRVGVRGQRRREAQVTGVGGRAPGEEQAPGRRGEGGRLIEGLGTSPTRRRVVHSSPAAIETVSGS